MAASCWFCLRVRPSSGMSSAGPQRRNIRELPPNFSRSPTLRAAHAWWSHAPMRRHGCSSWCRARQL